jgi:signal transduction histidine kinase
MKAWRSSSARASPPTSAANGSARSSPSATRRCRSRWQWRAAARRAEETLRRQEHLLWQTQKLEAMGTLASGIAHDFNNILTSIISNAELIRMDLERNHAAAPSNDEVLHAAERARLLVRQILSFSRHADTRRDIMTVSPICCFPTDGVPVFMLEPNTGRTRHSRGRR